MQHLLDGSNCSTMAQVRAGVDQVDREMVTLLSRRFDLMDAAARIKQERSHVRNEARKAEVIANVTSAAKLVGLSEKLISDFWERLVEASISYELDAFDRLRSNGTRTGA